MTTTAQADTDPRRWMRGASAPQRAALLSLVLDRPSHGGELASRLVGRLGDTWHIDTNDVYRLLDQLVEDGLLQTHEEPRRPHQRRNRLTYRPTDRTEQALGEWIETLLPREPVRLALHAKLAVSREEHAPQLMNALLGYERECLRLAQMVAPASGQARTWPSLVLECTRDAVWRQLQADIDWVAYARNRIDEHTKAQRHERANAQRR